MSRRRTGRNLCGFVLLDKPTGISSNQALQIVRRSLDARKAGHGGSLDPLAEGLLPILLGDATRLSQWALEGDKTYRFGIQFGAQTDTGDRDGEVIATTDRPLPSAADITAMLDRFRGPQQQIPPMYSALKQAGRPLYELARRGIEVERAARDIVIHELLLERVEGSQAWLQATVSKGTYIRTLAMDLALALGNLGHVFFLRRTAVAGLTEPGVNLEQLRAASPEDWAQWVQPASQWLRGWPQLELEADAVMAFQHGRPVRPFQQVQVVIGSECKVCDRTGRLLGLAQWDGQFAQPTRVFSGDALHPDGPGADDPEESAPGTCPAV